jgi:hypothetical protein
MKEGIGNQTLHDLSDDDDDDDDDEVCSYSHYNKLKYFVANTS